MIAAVFAASCGLDSSGKRTVVRIADWGGAGDDDQFARTIRDLRDQFEKENPDIDLQIEHIPGSQEYVRKMLLSFIADVEPDVMVLDASSAAVFINNGVLMNLMPLIERDPEFRLDDYYKNVVDIARRGDKIFAIPGDFTPMVMYYNKKLFDAANVPYPKSGWTWADFLDAAKRTTIPSEKPGDMPKQFGFKFANWMPSWIMWLWNNDADVLDPQGNRAKGYFDSDRSIESFQFVRDLIEVHKVAPSLSQSAAAGVDLFTNEQAAMEISGHWSMVGYTARDSSGKYINKIRPENVGVVELPTNIGKSVTVMYEAGFAIGKNCKNPEAAWRYIKFMTSKRVQSRYNATGIAVCARKDVSQERAINELEREFLRIVPSARAPWGSKVEGYDFVETTGQNAMDDMLKGGVSAEDALRRATKRIDEDFAKR